ncbi:MAG: lipoprotein-releasing system transmembrane subunit LolC [Rhodobacterales bacterium]|nr:MAG: lipoprotein-releasing system transmembrane subunit LolC [Rhodobacterales bacterium]
MIAWRYLRARKAEGGVSVMTVISFVGIMLAVAALIITLAVRSGFRAELVDTVVGSNAHITLYSRLYTNNRGAVSRAITDYDTWAGAVRDVPGVTRAAPIILAQVLGSDMSGENNSGIWVYGMRGEDLATLPRIAHPEEALGSIEEYENGIAIGSGVARTLGVGIGDKIILTSPNGAKTAFGTMPRKNAYEVTYIFTAGRWDIDSTRAYLPFDEAQSFFNREGRADQIEVMVEDPEAVNAQIVPVMEAAGPMATLQTWQDLSGAYLRALDMEDNVMFIILSILVLIASLNIISGLVMLVKNKGRDIGILRTMGLTQGSIMRVFFLCGSLTGVTGTIAGVILGITFVLNIQSVFAAVDWFAGGGVWDPSVRGIYNLPAKLELPDILSAVSLSLTLSFLVTILPARRAARLNPVEALRYE